MPKTDTPDAYRPRPQPSDSDASDGSVGVVRVRGGIYTPRTADGRTPTVRTGADDYDGHDLFRVPAMVG